jgi:vesicular inhibitory amino acid transporter
VLDDSASKLKLILFFLSKKFSFLIYRYLLIFVIYFQLLGAGVVFLLLAAQNLQSLFDAVHAHLNICIWIVIVAVVLLGPCWLGTPKDSW